MVNPQKYIDFVQVGKTHTHILFTCPVAGCTDPIVYVPLNDARQKSSRCLKHNNKHHNTTSTEMLTHQTPQPVCTPVEIPITSTINPCCENSRRPLEDTLDTIREEHRIERQEWHKESERRHQDLHQESERRHQDLHQESERRHQELLEELRATRLTLNGFVSVVARELRITPPDVVTVSVKLPKKLEFHNRRMNDLQASNQLFSNQMNAKERENTKLKRKVADLQRKVAELQHRQPEMTYPPVYEALHNFCKEDIGKKRMKAALHPDKLHGASSSIGEAAEIIRNGLEL
eukprot:2971225-Prymnesium_polylepis.5